MSREPDKDWIYQCSERLENRLEHHNGQWGTTPDAAIARTIAEELERLRAEMVSDVGPNLPELVAIVHAHTTVELLETLADRGPITLHHQEVGAFRSWTVTIEGAISVAPARFGLLEVLRMVLESS